MGKVLDPDELAAYRNVLQTLGHVTGYIIWKGVARESLDRDLPGCTQEHIHQLMIAHVNSGGEIHQTAETRPEYTEYRFHYDFRMPITGQRMYIETVFIHERDPDDCTIYVVSFHPA